MGGPLPAVLHSIHYSHYIGEETEAQSGYVAQDRTVTEDSSEIPGPLAWRSGGHRPLCSAPAGLTQAVYFHISFSTMQSLILSL